MSSRHGIDFRFSRIPISFLGECKSGQTLTSIQFDLDLYFNSTKYEIHYVDQDQQSDC